MPRVPPIEGSACNNSLYSNSNTPDAVAIVTELTDSQGEPSGSQSVGSELGGIATDADAASVKAGGLPNSLDASGTLVGASGSTARTQTGGSAISFFQPQTSEFVNEFGEVLSDDTAPKEDPEEQADAQDTSADDEAPVGDSDPDDDGEPTPSADPEISGDPSTVDPQAPDSDPAADRPGDTDVDVSLDPDPEITSDVQPESPSDSDTDTGTGTDPDADSDPDTGLDTDPDTNPGTGLDPDLGLGPDTGGDTGFDTDPNTDDTDLSVATPVDDLDVGLDPVEDLVGDIDVDVDLDGPAGLLPDGLTATSHIRGAMIKGEIAPMPIIALPANAIVGDRETCIEAGMDDYITKPVREAGFREMLAKWCKQTQQQPVVEKPAIAPPVEQKKILAVEDGVAHVASPPKSIENAPVAVAPVAMDIAATSHDGQKTAEVTTEENEPEVAVSIPQDDVIDMAGLDQTRQAMGEGSGTMLKIFAEDGKTYLEEISAAANDRALPICSRLAHTLKSSGKILGATKFAAAAADIEAYAKSDADTATLRQKIANLANLHREAIDRLSSL